MASVSQERRAVCALAGDPNPRNAAGLASVISEGSAWLFSNQGCTKGDATETQMASPGLNPADLELLRTYGE